MFAYPSKETNTIEKICTGLLNCGVVRPVIIHKTVAGKLWKDFTASCS